VKILSIKHEKDFVFQVTTSAGETKRCDFMRFFVKNIKHPAVRQVMDDPKLLHNPFLDEWGTPCWGEDVHEPIVDINPDNILNGLYDYVD
jgi:hypothetical protein